ncbi:hypothetical protein E2562_002385 [Oryza meyeriana var. granulata]|uniref:NAC domain-containing protein n=1 Tax=Oryza meyeriana var. granulata TaxID=110450 RepID=A0A6G1BIT1_9ORYZ|nr:hypothetical protein E2562_002385 [Oryza meyeriana var. granulata]
MGNQRLCSSGQEIKIETDPSMAAADDLVSILYLTQIYEFYESRMEEEGLVDLRVNAHLDGSKPCELPKCFVKKGPTIPWIKARKGNPIPLQDQHGAWSPIKDSFSAFSDGASPIGAKNFLEFILKDGTKTDWFMAEYYLLREIKDDNTNYE